MRMRAVLIAAATAFLARAEDMSRQKIELSNTQTLDFPAGGILRMTNAIGGITIESWDQPGMELTVVKSTKNVVDEKGKDAGKDKAAANKQLEDMKVTAERKGDEVLISTTYPKHELFARPFFGEAFVNVEYRIKLPRAARVNIDQYSGETNISGISGEIHVTDKRGQINVSEPEGQYTIDARSKFGDVDSDFPGMERGRDWVGKSFVASAQSTAPQKPQGRTGMFLRIGYGDILILKIH